MPPTAGLQDICAIRSRFMVIIAVRKPIRAQARAASQPACPAPTTMTSYFEDFMTLQFSVAHAFAPVLVCVGQIVNLRPIGNRPVNTSEFMNGPLTNLPQDNYLPHEEHDLKILVISACRRISALCW